MVDLGADLSTLAAVRGAASDTPEVGIVFDWNNWWAVEDGSKPTMIDYYENVIHWYRPFYEANVPVGVVHPTADLSSYKLLVIPNLYLLSRENAERISSFVQNGGRVIVTYFSAIVDENDTVAESGYLAGLEDALGIWIDDFAALAKGDAIGPAHIEVASGFFGDFLGTEWSEYLETTTADVVATFRGNGLDGSPAITRNVYGEGEAWYVATLPDAATTARLIDVVRREASVSAVVENLPTGVEAARRGGHLFLINQSGAGATVEVTGTDVLTGQTAERFELRPFDVVVLESGPGAAGD